MKRILIPILTLVLCLAGFLVITNHFQTFTIFSHTLHKAGPVPRPAPNLSLIDQDNHPFTIHQKDKYVLLNFMYINCPNACHIVNNKINEVYDDLYETPTLDNLEILTVTFDLKHDDIKKIKNYSQNFGDIPGWTFAKPHNYTQKEFDQIINDMGIWAYTMPKNQIINHSLYLFLISPEHEIVHIFDPARDSNTDILNRLNRYVKNEA